MIGSFGYLLARTARNRLVRQLRRLRQPRYVIALALGLAYLWLVLLQQRPAGPGGGGAPAGWIELAGALMLALAVLWAWVFSAERRVLAFSPAEVTFLFSAPVTRRQLVHFKLLRTQLVILLNTLLWTVLLSREGFGASILLRAVSLWVIFTTLSLHRLGASFVRTSLAEHGRAGARHRVVSLSVLAVAAGAIAWTALAARPALVAGWEAGIGEFISALAAVMSGPVPSALLLPFRLLVAPLAASTPAEWSRTLLPALGILVAHYAWVVRSDAAFEEAAAEESLRRARRVAERAGGPGRLAAKSRVPAPYRLRPTGPRAEAIFWKNLVSVARAGRIRGMALGLTAAGLLLGAMSFRTDGHVAEIAGWFAALWAGFLVVVGPQWIRSDLRGDLPKLDLLRTYPLPGRAIVGAEVAASTLVLSALQLGVAALAFLAFLGNRLMEPSLEVRMALLAGAAVLLPAVNLLGLLVQNAAAVLFPSWVHLGAGRPGGVEALGQNMLAIVAHVLVVGAALLPPAGVAALVLVGLRSVLGWWAAAPALVAGVALIGIEAAAAIGWLGRVFERTDPATALAS